MQDSVADDRRWMQRALRKAREGSVTLGCTALRGTTLYSTLQPCGMCSMAAIRAKIGRIVYGAGRADVHDMYFADRHLQTIDFIRDAYRDDLALSGGGLAAECAALYVAPGANIPQSLQFNR